MTGRIDLFTLPHKSLRHDLFALAAEAARTDPSELAGGHPLPGRAAALFERLEKHAAHEDRFIEPLLREVAPELAGVLAREHEAAGPEVSALRDLAGRLGDTGAPGTALRTFTLALNRFVGSYLLHLDHEERTVMPAIWAACDDARLMDVFGAFNASRTAEEIRDDALLMLPALSPEECYMLLAGSEAALSARGEHAMAAELAEAARVAAAGTSRAA